MRGVGLSQERLCRWPVDVHGGVDALQLFRHLRVELPEIEDFEFDPMIVRALCTEALFVKGFVSTSTHSSLHIGLRVQL